MGTRSGAGKQRRQPSKRAAQARRERERLAHQRRVHRRLLAGGAAVVVLTTIAITVALGPGSSKPTPGRSTPSGTSGPATVATQPFTPGTQAQLADSPPPWTLPTRARSYIAAAGLQVLEGEAGAVHYHAHLDIIVNSAAVPVPAGVGFVIENGQETGITALHTHDASGIIHIESPTDTPYTLGQFFTEEGVRLGTGQLGGLTDTGGRTLRVYVNGHEFTGDPATIVLHPHQEIALWYGPATVTPNPPARYQFPAGD